MSGTTKKRGIESTEGVSKRSGHTVEVRLLKFNLENQRFETYGFEPAEQERIVKLIHGRVEELGFDEALKSVTEEEKELILSSLGDPTEMKSMAWLVNSVSRMGVQEAVRGYWTGENLVLTEGNRRGTAIFIAKLRGDGKDILAVKADLEGRNSNEVDYLVRQYVSNSGVNFSPLEEARLFKKLIGYGWDEAQIAEVLGVPQTVIDRRLTLGSALPVVQNFVEEGVVSPSAVVEVIADARANGKGQAVVAEVISNAVESARSSGKKKASASDVKKAAKEKGVKLTPTAEEQEKRYADAVEQLHTLAVSLQRKDAAVELETIERVVKMLRKETGV